MFHRSLPAPKGMLPPLRSGLAVILFLATACDPADKVATRQPATEIGLHAPSEKRFVGNWACQLMEGHLLILRIKDDGTYRKDEIYLPTLRYDEEDIPIGKSESSFGDTQEGPINLQTGKIITAEKEMESRKQAGFKYEGVFIKPDGSLGWVRDHGAMGTEYDHYRRIDP